MYSWQIENTIKENGGVIRSSDLLAKLIDANTSIQLKRIDHNPKDNTYEMEDYEGNIFKFAVEINGENDKDLEECYIIKDALIIITPEGEVYTVQDNNQERHAELFNSIEDEDIQKIISEKSLLFGIMKLKILSQKGYTVLIGHSASSKLGKDYYRKVLNIPSNWNTQAEIKFNALLNSFENIPQSIIEQGFDLECNINMPNGETLFRCYYSNDDFKNKRFKSKEVAKLIKSKQDELESKNNNRRPGGWCV